MNEELLQMLTTGQVRVVFTKRTNGIIRNLLGTLNRTLIPPEQYTTLSTVLASRNPNLVVLWDIEVNDWRSFYISSVIKLFPV